MLFAFRFPNRPPPWGRSPAGRFLVPVLAIVLALSSACRSRPQDDRNAEAQARDSAAEATPPVDRQPQDWSQVAKVFGRDGETKANEGVYTTSFPRGDLAMKVEGEAVPGALGFTSWVAFKDGSEGAVAMSDMVLLQDEIDPAISALQESGIEVTALHRHFLRVEPDVMYLHSHASGDPATIARGYRAALERTGTPMGSTTKSGGEPVGVDSAAISGIVGHPGKASGGVFKITVGRDDLDVRSMGVEATTSMGLNSWAAFEGTDGETRVAGDISMLEAEVNPVIRALRAHGLSIVSVHNHMLGEDPRIVFLHYWGRGPAEELARGFRAALDELGG